MVRAAIIVLLVALQAIVGLPDYLSGAEHYLLRAATYSFFHGNWWHLAVNLIATWSIFVPSRKCSKMLLVAYFIAVLVYPLSFRPVIGFSNVLYAVLGLRSPALSSSWWKQPAVIAFLVITVALLFMPMFSATTHIAAFVLGIACAGARRQYIKLTRDARRYL